MGNYDGITIIPINGQFGAIRKQGSRCLSLHSWFLINNNFLSNNNWRQNLKPLTHFRYYCFEKRYYFWLKMLTLWKKNADFNKIKGTMALEGIFSETTYCKFQVSRIILKNIRQGRVNFTSPPHLKTKP